MIRIPMYLLLIGLAGCSKGTGSSSASNDTGTRADQTRSSETVAPGFDSVSNTEEAEIGEASDSATDSAKDSANATDRDSATNETDSAPETPEGAPERLYEFSGLTAIYSVDVDDKYIYFTTAGNLLRVEKGGGTETSVNLGASPTGAWHQNLALDSEYAYWIAATDVVKYNKTSAEKTLLSLEGQDKDLHAITSDDTRLYMAGPGCARVIGMSKNGGEMTISENPVTHENVCTPTTLTTDATHVYCGGGGCAPTMGKVFRCPKEGGAVTEVTTVPEVDAAPTTVAMGPQATGMAVVNDKIYFIENFRQDPLLQYFGWAPAAGGEYTRIAELRDTRRTKRLHHDPDQNALYFLASGHAGARGIYKYDLSESKLFYEEIVDAFLTPMAMDEEYFYWPTSSELYRMKKF